MNKHLITVVMPAYNEAQNIENTSLDVISHIPDEFDFEIIIINDGSRDNTHEVALRLNGTDKRIKLLTLSRNFGKEIATSAGLAHAKGDATIILDADGQHPPEYIPEFIKEWQKGSQIVVGVRQTNSKEGFIKRFGSKLFYLLLNRVAGVNMVPASTDFRLIDREVRESFVSMKETNRITRGLIDWLGFDVTYLNFHAKPRQHGNASYSIRKLFKLATNSVVSLSLLPLYISGYVGVFITILSLFGGLFVLIENYILNDPMGLNITSSGALGLLIIFLVGIVLISQGLLALYISRIYEESRGRPLFVINKAQSIL